MHAGHHHSLAKSIFTCGFSLGSQMSSFENEFGEKGKTDFKNQGKNFWMEWQVQTWAKQIRVVQLVSYSRFLIMAGKRCFYRHLHV